MTMKTILNLSVGITLLVMPQVSPTANGSQRTRRGYGCEGG